MVHLYAATRIGSSVSNLQFWSPSCRMFLSTSTLRHWSPQLRMLTAYTDDLIAAFRNYPENLGARLTVHYAV